jgi:glycosyltransferase involved in cell wall biosynthesis
MSASTVSFIVPVYNAANYLVRCVESIRRQTYTDIQILLINDGSKDVSLPLCEMFRRLDGRVVVVDRPHRGISDTRNAGLDLVRGKYIQFVDSDDYLPRDATERMVAAIQGCDMVIAPYTLVINDALREYTCIEDEAS